MAREKLIITRILQGCDKCGYRLEAFLGGNDVAVMHGFKTEVTIECPNCGQCNFIKKQIKHDRQRNHQTRD